MGYTYQQLQQMGATPVAKKGKTLEELKAMGATNPNEFPKQEPESVKQGFFSRLGAATKKTFTEDIPGIFNTQGEILKGAVKGVGSTVAGAEELGQKGIDAISKPIAEGVTGKQYKPVATINEMYGDKFIPTNNNQKVGYAAEKIAEFAIPGRAGIKAAEGANLLTKAGVGALESGLVTAVQTGGDAKETATNAVAGGAMPLVGEVVKLASTPIKQVLSEKISPALLNKYVLKPGANAFNFGKDPGMGVAKEGLKANTREGLLTQIIDKKNQIGKEIDSVLKTVKDKVIDIKPALKTLDDDITQASEAGEEALYNRLVKIREGITSKFKIVEGKAVKIADNPLDVTPYDAALIKRKIGAASKWTGQAFDNEANQARVKVYRVLNDLIDEAVPGAKKLNARWANMLTAEKALEHTIDVVKKQSSLGLINAGAGVAAGVASFASGDSAPESIAKSLAVSLGLKGLQSTAVQSRLASSFATLNPEEKTILAKSIPLIRNIIMGIKSTPQNDG